MVIHTKENVYFSLFAGIFKGQLMWIIEDKRNVNKESSRKNLR